MIKRVKKLGAFMGKFLDAEDRQAVGAILVWVSTISFAVMAIGLSLGLGFRLFELARG